MMGNIDWYLVSTMWFYKFYKECHEAGLFKTKDIIEGYIPKDFCKKCARGLFCSKHTRIYQEKEGK